MEIAEPWDELLVFFIESRESPNLETFNGMNVEFELHGDRTLRSRFALMELKSNCGDYGC